MPWLRACCVSSAVCLVCCVSRLRPALAQEGDFAVQLYYIRPRFGDFFWDSVKATKLRVMLEAAIQRRFPKGLKVCVVCACLSVGFFLGLPAKEGGWGVPVGCAVQPLKKTCASCACGNSWIDCPCVCL